MPGRWKTPIADRGLVVEQAAQRVAARSELEAGDVREARDLSLLRRADDDVAELLFRRQPALRVDRELERRVRRRRRRAEHAGRHLDVLFADRAHDVGRRQLARGQPIRIEPDAHAVFAGAEDLHGADARQARQLVLHLQERVVRQVEHVVAVVRRDQVHDHQEVGRRLFGRHADALHVLRQARQRLRHAVLHLHLRVVEVGAERERDGQRQRAVRGRLREHVEHVLDAVHLLLERRGHGFGDHLRVGARERRAHDDRRRHDGGIFADRQLQERQGAGDDDPDGEDDGEDRSGDEEGREVHCAPPIVGHRRVDLHAGPHALQAVDHDQLAGRQPLADDAQAVDERPERDGPRLDLLVGADDQHEAAIEIGADRAILDEHARIRRACPADGGGRTVPASDGGRGCGRSRGR